MKRLLSAFESGDEATIRALLADGEHTLILGSDPNEWYLGSDAVELIAFQAREMPPFHYEIRRLAAFEEEGLGWAAADVRSDLGSGPPIDLRMSAVFHLEDGVWKAIHWHTSTPRPDDPEIVGAEISETMGRILDSIDEGVDFGALRRELSTNTVTIVFTDLEDSTRQAAETGDETWSELIRRHLKALERIAADHDGVVLKTVGDGAMLAFGSARQAVEAALVARESSAPPRSARLKIGINTGEAVSTGDDLFGQAVNLAARMTAAAEPGEILVSEVTRSLVGDAKGLDFEAPRSFEFKGIDGVRSVHPVRRSPISPDQ